MVLLLIRPSLSCLWRHGPVEVGRFGELRAWVASSWYVIRARLTRLNLEIRHQGLLIGLNKMDVIFKIFDLPSILNPHTVNPIYLSQLST